MTANTPRYRRGARAESLIESFAKFDLINPSTPTILSILKSMNTERCKPPLSNARLREISKQIAAHAKIYKRDHTQRVAEKTLESDFSGGKHLYYSSNDARFRWFDTTHWRVVQDAWLLKKLLATHNSLAYRGALRPNAVANEALGLLKMMLAEKDDVFAGDVQPKRIVNCRNGEVWLRDNGEIELRPHKASSRQQFCLPIDYDPEARAPLYDRALREIFQASRKPNALVRHWNEFMGYVIQPDRHIPLIVVLLGTGQNGKSKLVEILTSMLGKDLTHATAVENLLSNRFEVGSLRNKRIFVDEDVDAGTTLPDGTLKKISEAKVMTGEIKNGPHFTFVSRVIPILVSNGVPRLRDSSHGLLRRLHVIPFRQRFEGSEDDTGLFQRIQRKELSGVLNRALEGWQRFHRRGGFKIPEDVDRATVRFVQHSNPLKAFLKEGIAPSKTQSILLKDLYGHYVKWARSSGYRPGENQNDLKRGLLAGGYSVRRSNRGLKVARVKLKN